MITSKFIFTNHDDSLRSVGLFPLIEKEGCSFFTLWSFFPVEKLSFVDGILTLSRLPYVFNVVL